MEEKSGYYSIAGKKTVYFMGKYDKNKYELICAADNACAGWPSYYDYSKIHFGGKKEACTGLDRGNFRQIG